MSICTVRSMRMPISQDSKVFRYIHPRSMLARRFFENILCTEEVNENSHTHFAVRLGFGDGRMSSLFACSMPSGWCHTKMEPMIRIFWYLDAFPLSNLRWKYPLGESIHLDRLLPEYGNRVPMTPCLETPWHLYRQRSSLWEEDVRANLVAKHIPNDWRPTRFVESRKPHPTMSRTIPYNLKQLVITVAYWGIVNARRVGCYMLLWRIPVRINILQLGKPLTWRPPIKLWVSCLYLSDSYSNSLVLGRKEISSRQTVTMWCY